MSEEVKKRPVIRPYRSDRPSLSSPSQAKPLPTLTLVTQPTLPDQEDDGHSRETVKSSTPIFCHSLHELNLDIQPKDATTPVMAGQSPMPLPPDSPSIKLTPAAPLSVTSSVHYSRDQQENQRETRATGLTTKRAGSQREARKKTHKKNMGVIIGNFNGLYPDELSVKEGEEIEIISKDTYVSRNIGWWTGRNAMGKIGIFPAACVSCELQGKNAGGSTNYGYSLEIKNSEVEMKEVIGIGGFGKVFRALYKGEEVAVKVAKSTTFDSLKAVQDVVSEAERFAHLAHNNICALVGVVLVKDVCLVMEYAEGGALSEVLHKSGVSLSIDVITNWTSQIAAGMHYLHHEAHPSLIHRDLKTSNILLYNSIDSSNLKKNVIKITDFGLAREIEHTTHMSGAGTYPWMAPEVIRTSDFSKKSDVWSFAVVVWELVTGERPYGGLNLFVVAYGVGHGSLSLPIPDGCPEPLANLMEDCWKRDYAERPSFEDILLRIRSLEGSAFCTSMSHEDFYIMQSSWRGEIQKKFIKLKALANDIRKKEEILVKKISEQEQKRKELEEEKKLVDIKMEEANRIINQFYSQQQQPNKGEEAVDANYPHHAAQLVRPPRYKRFSFRRLFMGSKAGSGAKVNNPLPDRVEIIRAFRRITSSPAPSVEKRGPTRTSESLFDRHERASPAAMLPKDGEDFYRGHKRRSSDEYRGGSKHLSIEQAQQPHFRRGSMPSSPNNNRSTHSHQPVIAQHGHTQQQKTTPLFGLKRDLDKKSTRQRSWSDLRSPSPQQLLLPSYVSPGKLLPTATPILAPATSILTPASSAPTKPVTKPAFLALSFNKSKLSSQETNSPSSPNVTITPAEHPLSQYDSGKDSMTCSDASGHSNCSESLIKLDSPVYTQPSTKGTVSGMADYIAAEFDPLRTSISHDSLLTAASGPQGISSSPTPTPARYHNSQEGSYERGSAGQWMNTDTFQWGGSASSTSPKSQQSDNTSPRQSLTTTTDSSCSSIARPRPRAAKDFTNLRTISAPSSRPPSPRERSSTGGSGYGMYRSGATSPTGSVQSMRATFSLDSDYGDDFYIDSDTTSTSSLIDLSVDVDEEFTTVVQDIHDYNFSMLDFLSQQ